MHAEHHVHTFTMLVLLLNPALQLPLYFTSRRKGSMRALTGIHLVSYTAPLRVIFCIW